MVVLPCSAVLFDCDGGLVDSALVIHRSWIRWARETRVDSAMVLAAMHGRRSADTVIQFVEQFRVDDALALSGVIDIDDAAAITAIPGAAALVASIPGDRWAIVTSVLRALASARLAAAGLPIPRIVISSEDVTQGKPRPEGYLAAANRLGFPAERCVVVEDAPAGVRAARAAHAGGVLGVSNL